MGDDDEEDFVFYGTPLPDFEDFSLLKKQAAELKVRDEQGRQRFHGAFTGGFSAGYFNTVGSKEGWIPSNFSSSRSQKASSFRQNPEDFMDDEDFSVFGIAHKTVRTTSNFRDSDAVEPPVGKKRRIDETDAIIPGEPPLKELVKPVEESVGIQILKKMGWRHGQGIGPKVKRDAGIKIYGCSLGPLTSNEKDSSDFNVFEFAPEETPEVAYVPKDDCHGIGYSGLSTRAILNAPCEFSASSTKTWLPKEKKKIGIRGQAFGVGALEDDDDDIYGRDDMSQYDFSEFLGSKTNEDDLSNAQGKKSQLANEIGVLEGFCLSTKPSVTKKQYPLPELPRNFQPMHLRKKIITKPTMEIKTVRDKMNPIARSILLGEKSFVKEGSSSQSDQANRLRSRFCTAPDDETPMFPPGLVGNITLKPFSQDEKKQKRYEQFLQSKDDKELLYSSQPSSMTEWQRQQEFDEFTKTSSLYKPFSTGLKSRFDSKLQLSMGVTSKSQREDTDQKSAKKSEKPVREVLEWHPTSLLCKRFNVPNPYPDSTIQGTPGSEIRKQFLFESMIFESTAAAQNSQEIVAGTTDASGVHAGNDNEVIPEDSAVHQDKSEETSQNISENAESYIKGQEKPPMDLFRDIFKSSSSEESEPDEPETVKSSEKQDSVVQPAIENQSKSNDDSLTQPSTSSYVPKKPAFGVFANLDLDALNKRTPSANKIDKDQKSEDQSQNCSNSLSSESMLGHKSDVIAEESTADDYYGPELPPPGATPLASDENSRQRLVHHKHSKHKHHKHKVKKKKKKKKKKKYSTKDGRSSSSEDDSDDDVPPEILIQKLKELQKLKYGKR